MNANNNGLVELNQEELKQTEGGFIMFVVGHAITGAYLAAMFEAGRQAAK